MQVVDLNRPGEKKKLIWAAILGFVAIIFLWWTFVGFGSSPSSRSSVRPTATPTPQRTARQDGQQQVNGTVPPAIADLSAFREVVITPSSYNAPEARRNIFAYYEPPVKPAPVASVPSPSPTPPPPLLLASISPANAYARSADFKLEVAGDKFTPEVRIYVDGRELPTAYLNPQQVSANVPASFIATPGARQIVVRTADNRLYSNQVSLSVAAPPVPNYTYVGIISTQNRVDDTALVQDKNNKNIIGVRRGDLLSGRFRVTSISDKELVLVDATLKIKHPLGMSEGDKSFGSPLSRPTPRVDAEDDEP
jgi:hypothetical protein